MATSNQVTSSRAAWILMASVVWLPGIAMAQVDETIDRGVVALTVKEKVVYVGWRLLKDDPEGMAFNVYRKDMGLGDVTDEYPGIECYAGEAKGGDKFFLYSAQGKRLSDKNLWGLAPQAIWWDADALKEICYKNKVIEYSGEEKQQIEGRVLIVADILGDWREEIVTSLPGELRIYSTNIPARTRQICLMQNHLYRMAVADASMGYYNAPQVGFK